MTKQEMDAKRQARIDERKNQHANAWYAKNEQQGAVLSQLVHLQQAIAEMLCINEPVKYHVNGVKIFAEFNGHDAVGAVRMQSHKVPFSLKKLLGVETEEIHPTKGYKIVLMPWDMKDWTYDADLDKYYADKFVDLCIEYGC